MGFNVCNKDGKHIGIVINNNNPIKNTALVAITDLTTNDIEINWNEVTSRLASTYKCKSLLGKINHEKLKEELKKVWMEDYRDLGDYSDEYIKKILLFREFTSFGEYIHIEEGSIQGYVLLNVEDIHFKNEDYIMIKEDLDYVSNRENVLVQKPLYCKIIDYPILDIDVMGAEGLFLGGGLADLGGMNHAHETKLKIISGNVVEILKFPIHMHVKKGMYINIYFEEEKIKGVFCDGVIYQF
ncbi:MAG: hypothetical protein JJT76_11210 [Clostridiaceae bacterium]|nr:hypothetical protein [Clostridiaceae bacterium]